MFFRTIKFQITAALVLQAIVLIAVVFSTLYLLKLRQHDYIILNLTGQLRVIALTLIKQSENYVTNAPRNYEAYHRDLVLFNIDLKKQINDFDKIIFSLKERSISADLVNYFYYSEPNNKVDKSSISILDENIQCNWDEQSTNQLNRTVNDWISFKKGLQNSLGQDLKEPRLEYATQYIAQNKQIIITSTSKLSTSFRKMMEKKLHQIDNLNKAAILIILIISISLLTILYFKLFKKLDKTVSGFKRITDGELGYQIKVDSKNEIGEMTLAFNSLTQRIHSLLKLTDGINQSNDLGSTLKFLFTEFDFIIPVDFLCFAQHNSEEETYQLSRIFSHFTTSIKEMELFDITNSFYEHALIQKVPVSTQDNSNLNSLIESDRLVKKLSSDGLNSILLIPLSYDDSKFPGNDTALILASKTENAYTVKQQEFLRNTVPQISHAVSKTIGMESLIISVVEGLAKLAESRDPETGDHLYRMSHYSRILAEQLAIKSPYSHEIDANYIRSLFRFAPMHDIGKVGIGDYILLKPGALTDEERLTMQQHPVIGAEVMRRCDNQVQSFGESIFKLGIEIAESHHEKFDGSGYPNKLIGNDIPLSARIVAVADVFDALTSKRPYKEAWDVDKALSVIRQDSGSHFDPEIILALDQAMPTILEIYNKHKHV